MKIYQKKSVIARVIYAFLAIFLLLVGFSLVFASSADFIKSNQILSDQKNSQEQLGVKPLKIFIPSIDRTLDISDGYVVDNRWTVSETGVSHLTTSAVPGNRGNAVLYGHNRDEVLGKLWKAQNNDLVYVILSDGSITKYQIFERREVEPSQVEILNNVGDSRLTIYTCSGFLDSARFVIVGKLI
ncbi:hypothetical protein A3J17_01575 [Candidatus Curtissbacteria bacterium RIFCSPLOWO2_02_FULL_40_11]|uniref:Sortase n=2 Tax=Candidatus Curtissiibacteriota TaxID=1752717 RepID=A0A1F5G8R8_9BACT|nr:MAG: hypothetical protein A3D04_02725 [Candidatus Curtissbacteria bacterium RIFCSPHIGHO2_02_FULL_40_16b]OGE01436.1 MAG: hypothetical protein A3J17_01575 [Candidatus Curtissbacteria bacterium RIFCSPLOWO2_02_FULL_40_11]OGE12597.1 MAG: hypothetical protein A3G14_00130 [Candidatus Curtissbacteria bacterium RIFCSPLOWO2_12_FULL_38_9]